MEFYPVHFLWHIVTATLFLMSLYSIIIGFRSKLKAFYWYFIYSFFLLIYVQFKSNYFYILQSDDDFISTLYTIMSWFVQIIYNSAYFFFFIYLLDAKKHIPKFAEFIKKSIISLFLLSVIMVFITLLMNNPNLYVNYFYYGFTPLTALLGISVLIKLWQIPGKLKIIFFMGGFTYMNLAITALVLSHFNINTEDLKGFTPLVPFYIGIIIEQICFGFALGYFTDQINQRYRLVMTQNLNLKQKHNEELTKKLNAQSKRLKQLGKKAKEKEVALVKSEYESKLSASRLSSLQSKMNPHFIFNALNSIKAFLIENDKRKAVDYMNRFSKLVRKILESSRIESISLEEELNILKLYIEIENTRFNNEILFFLENTVQQNALNIKIPPLILQPFVENALWHGLAPSEKNKKLCIKISEVQNVIKVEIEDNGVGREQSFLTQKSRLKKKSMGMKMTQERLEVFNEKFDTDYHFEIIDKSGKETGTLVKVYLKQNH